MAVIPVELAGRSYHVHVGRALLDNAADIASAFLRRKQVPVVADANAWAAHGARLAQSLGAAGCVEIEPIAIAHAPGVEEKQISGTPPNGGSASSPSRRPGGCRTKKRCRPGLPTR